MTLAIAMTGGLPPRLLLRTPIAHSIQGKANV